jgi:2',3'-cyclic-nucleotide 2'-phosphodiesterase (5'-nucleotidase family)
MTGFIITTPQGEQIRFVCYTDTAPVTSQAFMSILPFTRTFYHARVSGQEIWIDDVPQLDIIQENASVFTQPGEVVFGPAKPVRAKTANCFGIYYGEGKGLDACNIFAKVMDEDRQKLSELGNNIWKNGAITLTVSKLTYR